MLFFENDPDAKIETVSEEITSVSYQLSKDSLPESRDTLMAKIKILGSDVENCISSISEQEDNDFLHVNFIIER